MNKSNRIDSAFRSNRSRSETCLNQDGRSLADVLAARRARRSARQDRQTIENSRAAVKTLKYKTEDGNGPLLDSHHDELAQYTIRALGHSRVETLGSFFFLFSVLKLYQIDTTRLSYNLAESVANTFKVSILAFP